MLRFIINRFIINRLTTSGKENNDAQKNTNRMGK